MCKNVLTSDKSDKCLRRSFVEYSLYCPWVILPFLFPFAEGSSDLNKNGNILIQWLSRPNPNYPRISSRKTSLYSSQPGLHSDSRSRMSVLCWALPISVLLSLQGRPWLAPWPALPAAPCACAHARMSERQSFRFSFGGGCCLSLSLCVWGGSDRGRSLAPVCASWFSLALSLFIYLSSMEHCVVTAGQSKT